MIVHWPGGGLPEGRICTQYHHVTDIVPTLLGLAGNPGESLDGISLAYTFDSPTAPTRKQVQFFETAGDRAIWVDGWKAVTQHRANTGFDDDYWALYYAPDDFSEIHDRAAEAPERVADMIALWHREAERNNVLPLEDDLLSLEADVAPAPRTRYVLFPGATRIDRRSAPDIFNHDYTITAEVEIDAGRANGVLLASGDSMAGYELLMRDGYLEYVYVFTRGRHHSARTRYRVPPGRHVLALHGRKTSASSGRVELSVDGRRASAALDIPRMWEVKSLNAGIRCGENRGAPVSRLYRGAFRFNRRLDRLTFELEI